MPPLDVMELKHSDRVYSEFPRVRTPIAAAFCSLSANDGRASKHLFVVVQERLRHSTISMTLDTYSHVVPGGQERAVADLKARLFGGSRTKGPSKSPP